MFGMDSPTLIKIEAKRNLFLVSAIASAFGFLIILLSISEISLPLIEIYYILAVIGIIFIVTVSIAAYFGTIVNGYNYLLGRGSYSGDHNKFLDNIRRDNVTIPQSFFEKDKNFLEIYKDAFYSYLHNYPNASLPTTLRCLEVGLKYKYSEVKNLQNGSPIDNEFVGKVDEQINNISKRKSKNTDINDVPLFDFINCAEPYFSNKAETLRHLNSLRNFIHGSELIKPNDAHSALTKVTDILNILFPLTDKINVDITCKICGNKHKYNIDKESYLIGKRIALTCTNPNIQSEDKNYLVTLMP